MSETKDTEKKPALDFRRFTEGEPGRDEDWEEHIFQSSWTHKCPTYVHRTPPCQGSCPSGEDVRGWLNVVRGLETTPDGMTWQEYAFRRVTDANPFPSVMGRVCPAPCEDGCNRNEVEDHVGINAVEHFIGDNALSEGYAFEPPATDTGKKVAIIGGGPAGLACAYQLRRKGHACTVFDIHEHLGGMMRYGIPGYRTPNDLLDQEIQRILDLGVEVRLNTRIGTDVALADLEKDYDAVLFAMGAQTGYDLPVEGADAPNCLTGVAFLGAFNDGRLKHAAQRVVVIGGGDTAMDVASVARRIGHIADGHEKDRPETAVLGHVAHDVASIAARQGSEVRIVIQETLAMAPAAEKEIEDVRHEGIEIEDCLDPVCVVKDGDGRAIALRVQKVRWENNKIVERLGEPFDIACDLVVSAIGQKGDLKGMEEYGNDRGMIDADPFFEVKGKPGFFVAGDIVRPHLLTTAIGQAAIAADSIDHYLKGETRRRRPKVDVHHFKLLNKLRETGLAPEAAPHEEVRGTSESAFAIHNFEDRSAHAIAPADELFLGHFTFEARTRRAQRRIAPDQVLGDFDERVHGLTDEQAQAEAARCMSCGSCLECNNCIVFCPQDAVLKVPKSKRTHGRYVYTDYTRCIGCHICADVCPTGYIQMGLGE
jgi:NADPH-dependent glutamate synthase beta subunit-like oxidoreductase